MPSPTFHGSQIVSNQCHDIQPHGQGFVPPYGQLSFGSHNLHSTQTAILGTHNLSQSCRNSNSFNFNTNKPVPTGVGTTVTTTVTTTIPSTTIITTTTTITANQTPHSHHHHHHHHHHTIKSLENVLENLELNNANSPTRKTSHNFNAVPEYSESERLQKNLTFYGKSENSPKLLPENVGIPYPHEEISHRLSTDSHKAVREIRAPKLPTGQEDIRLNCILNTPELPPKVHLGKKSPVFTRSSGETLFHFDPQRIHRVNSTSQDGNS